TVSGGPSGPRLQPCRREEGPARREEAGGSATNMMLGCPLIRALWQWSQPSPAGTLFATAPPNVAIATSCSASRTRISSALDDDQSPRPISRSLAVLLRS